MKQIKKFSKTLRSLIQCDCVFSFRDINLQFNFLRQAIVHAYDTASSAQPDPNTTHAMLGVHASASAIIHYGKVARKHGQINSALDSLSRIHSIPSVPIVDCFQKIRQQVKCYLHMATVLGKSECMQASVWLCVYLSWSLLPFLRRL